MKHNKHKLDTAGWCLSNSNLFFRSFKMHYIYNRKCADFELKIVLKPHTHTHTYILSLQMAFNIWNDDKKQSLPTGTLHFKGDWATCPWAERLKTSLNAPIENFHLHALQETSNFGHRKQVCGARRCLFSFFFCCPLLALFIYLYTLPVKKRGYTLWI